MLKRYSSALAAVVLLLCFAPSASAQIRGDYLETRSADVWTGPCFANGEVNLTGNEATMAWKIRSGEWNGTKLDGLSVVAVARASATLGDPYRDPYPAHAVLLLDQNATEAQKPALIAFAKAMGGRLLDNVVMVQSEPITMRVGEGAQHGSVEMRAGDLARVATRLLSDRDRHCGNEYTYYPPLTELSHSMPVVALENEYVGNSLGAEWKIYDKRSAFVGTFER